MHESHGTLYVFAMLNGRRKIVSIPLKSNCKPLSVVQNTLAMCAQPVISYWMGATKRLQIVSTPLERRGPKMVSPVSSEGGGAPNLLDL